MFICEDCGKQFEVDYGKKIGFTQEVVVLPTVQRSLGVIKLKEE